MGPTDAVDSDTYKVIILSNIILMGFGKYKLGKPICINPNLRLSTDIHTMHLYTE